MDEIEGRREMTSLDGIPALRLGAEGYRTPIFHHPRQSDRR
jgi:hypothetical protein